MCSRLPVDRSTTRLSRRREIPSAGDLVRRARRASTLNRLGAALRIFAIDPLYRLDTRAIRDRITATYDQMLDQAQRNSQQFVWDAIQSVVTPVLSRYQRTMRNKRGPLWPFL
jgi:hypothetical protein